METAFHRTTPAVPANPEMASIVSRLQAAGPLKFRRGRFARWNWFIFANAGVLLSVTAITGGSLGVLPLLLLPLSCLFPFFALLCSKWLAKSIFKLQLIDGSATDPRLRGLHDVVESLSRRAGLKRTPEVVVYASDDVNAFATGFSRNTALVAFSTALLEKMDERSAAAVAAHEISHVANGDMVTLALVQSVVNSVIYAVTIPLTVVKWIAFFDERVSAGAYYLVAFARWLAAL
ncbi:MAG: M48 family metalloprotease [Alicyclobacillus sp.]|nr:M48 family metalloprotease [Alicyclobacillus sp.]